jgi:hypothetical protein
MTTYWNNKTALRGLGILCLYTSFSLLVTACNPSQTGEETPIKTPETNITATKLQSELTPAQEEQDDTAATAGAKADRQHVLDYFRNLPEPYALPYRIWQEDRLWMAEHQPSGKVQQAFVDLQNGYLEVAYVESDTVAESVQAALFRMEEDAPVLAVCRTQTNKNQVQQECRFLRPEDASQLDWTEHTLPVFTPFDFFSPEAEARLDNEFLEDAFPMLVKLPQYGTDLRVQLYLGRRFHYCGDSAGKAEKVLCPLFDEMERRSFTLKWNRQSGQFN